MSRPIIVVDEVSKDFNLPHNKKGSVKNIFTGLLSFSSSSYEVQHALKNISFEIKEGEFFGIVGRNGSGKSTLLKMLAGIYQPSKGNISVGGRVVPFIELGVGFNGDLTGRENVYLNGALMGFSEKEIDKKYSDIVEFAELDRFMDQKLKNYSSGMQVRLAFSVATRLAESDILLIDEVLAVGDADFQRKCFRYFKQLKKEGKTVIFVTHDMNAVREYCDRAAFIEKSELVKVDSAEEISKMYEQLLSSTSNTAVAGEISSRWGDGSIKITEVKVQKISSKEIILKITAEAQADCEDPVFGFSVNNGAGVPLFGTNTIIEKKKIKKLKNKEKIGLSWKFANVLSDGEYSVTVAAQLDGGLTNADWWQDSCKLNITRASHTPYSIDPGVEVNID